jgi:hypothetical protein
MQPRKPTSEFCPDCQSGLNRRDFIAAVGGAALAASVLPATRAVAAPTPTSSAETAAKRLYQSLTQQQRSVVVVPWSDKRRTNISANWHVTEANVGSFTPEQQETIHEILKGVTSPDGYERFLKQMAADDAPGVNKYSVALYGSPDENKFEFELTGRHLTLRADGNTTENVAFGGPIVYGHGAAGNSQGNLFWYQTKRVNEVFQALDGKQREVALLEKAPPESAVQFRKSGEALPGIRGGDLSADQRELVAKVLADVLAPYRKEDVDEAMECLKAGGGLEQLHVAFYKTGDLGDDGVWDVWRLESPTVVCHFRGAPHVHAYINIAKREA